MKVDEFKAAVEADKQAGLHDRKQKEIEAAEDAYFEALGAEIEKHPLGGSGRAGRSRRAMSSSMKPGD